jgi:trehalose 6-phosphate synthase
MNDSPRNKARRMRVMRRQVFENDIEKWASTFLDDLEELNGPKSANRVAG